MSAEFGAARETSSEIETVDKGDNPGSVPELPSSLKKESLARHSVGKKVSYKIPTDRLSNVMRSSSGVVQAPRRRILDDDNVSDSLLFEEVP